MHLKRDTSNAIELYFYSQYFWYLEISKATRALGAYLEDELVGVLLVDMKGEPKVYQSVWASLYNRIAEFVISKSNEATAGPYEEANQEMLSTFHQRNHPDGELNFFAVDPEMTGHGIGTKLPAELETLEAGKQIYLFSDSSSTYEFYQHRGFKEEEKREITIKTADDARSMACFIFSKRLQTIGIETHAHSS